MTQKTIREIALEVAERMSAYQATSYDSGTTHECYEFSLTELPDFAEYVLAAYLAQQEAVAYVDDWSDCIFGQLTEDHIASGTNLYKAPPTPAGMVLVPVEPTKEMLRAAWLPTFHCEIKTTYQMANAYKAMLNAVKESK